MQLLLPPSPPPQTPPLYPQRPPVKKEPSVLWLFLAGFLWLMVPVVIVIALFSRDILQWPFNGFTPDKYTSRQVLDAFRAGGLEVGTATPYSVQAQAATPFPFIDGFNFTIPSSGNGAGGSITSFKTADDMAKAKAYIASITDQSGQSPLFTYRLYQKDNVLVTIPMIVPEAAARKYEAALAGLTAAPR